MDIICTQNKNIINSSWKRHDKHTLKQRGCLYDNAMSNFLLEDDRTQKRGLTGTNWREPTALWVFHSPVETTSIPCKQNSVLCLLDRFWPTSHLGLVLGELGEIEYEPWGLWSPQRGRSRPKSTPIPYPNLTHNWCWKVKTENKLCVIKLTNLNH